MADRIPWIVATLMAVIVLVGTLALYYVAYLLLLELI
jgi:hypothetical protein